MQIGPSPGFRHARWRTWIRVHTPSVLYDRLGLVIPKVRECGDHEWYAATELTEHCYHCLAERPLRAWDTLDPGRDFGTRTGHRVSIEVGLTSMTAREAGIRESAEIRLVTAAAGARDIAARLAAAADQAEALNAEQGLPRPSAQVTFGDAD